jgi:SAM-dependent methyltransferase
MKSSVDSSLYNSQYFKDRYREVNYRKLKKLSDFENIYQKSGSLLKLDENDEVIDLGCGTGQLCLCLYLKYGCDITGVDYSPDAIGICNANIRELEKESGFNNIGKKIKFLLVNNEQIPDFQDVKAVYMIDIIEHLYNKEIDLVLHKIKEWSGENGIYLVIHTDNNNYLKFVLPLTNFISVVLGKTSYRRIKYEKEIVMKGHVNLTTAGNLVKKLRLKNFDIVKLEYPEINLEITKSQIGPIGKNKIILYPIYFFGKLLFFLRPSFYLLAKYKK